MQFDVLVVGSGLAGLTAALELAEHKTVGILTKRNILDSASDWAQGGIAAVISEEDSIEAHTNDTKLAGAGLCREQVVSHVIQSGKKTIDWLLERGVAFTTDSTNQSGYHLTREGGHTLRRILHSADATGHEIQGKLETLVKNIKNITLIDHHVAIDLITSKHLHKNENQRCYGIYALDKNNQKVVTIKANQVILATGGAGKIYVYTTNPDTASGDGIAMGWRAGCHVTNMEFIQFHPTCLYHPYGKSFLISESLRGEGGKLCLKDGTLFMGDHHPDLELAPRDIVARAIDFEMKKRGLDNVYLNISHQSSDFIIQHFPHIYAHCKKLGLDITKEPIPIVPAAHYTCGGIETDLHGLTNVKNLYAIGETAHTGLHGANRLASNSLLECIVFGRSAADHIRAQNTINREKLPNWDDSQVTDPDEEIVISHNWDELRRFMWDYVGIVRTNKRLERAFNRINLLKHEVNEYYSNFRVSADLIELRNLVLTAELVVRSALKRKESRGLHFSQDYQETKLTPIDSVLIQQNN